MPVTMEINDLSNKELAQQYVNDMKSGQITTKQLIRNFKISPKYAHYILKTHPSTMLGKPREFSSNKYINYNLYEKVDDSTVIELCNHELESLKKTKPNINEFLSAGFSQYMYDKYRIKPTFDIINALKLIN